MQYTPWAIDSDKLEKAIQNDILNQERQTISDKERADAYLSGYKKAAHDVINSLHCANYEKAKDAIKAQPDETKQLIIGTDIHCYDCAFDGENRDRKKQRCLKGIDGTNGCGLWKPKGKGENHD